MAEAQGLLVIGIDPGVSGAIAALTNDMGAAVVDMPVQEKGGTGKLRHQIDARALAVLLERLTGNHTAKFIVERVSTMPGRPGAHGHDRSAPQQSGAGSFSLGDSVGCIRGVIGALGYDIIWVPPQRWKRYWSIVGEDQKEQARQHAWGLYPDLEADLKRKKDHNRAEALLIARWGKDQEIER